MIGIVAGFALGAVGGPVLGMIGFCLAAFNFFALQPILFTYPATRLTGAALAGGIAFVNTIGLMRRLPRPVRHGHDAGRHRLQALRALVHRGHVHIGALLSLHAQARHGKARSSPPWPH